MAYMLGQAWFFRAYAHGMLAELFGARKNFENSKAQEVTDIIGDTWHTQIKFEKRIKLKTGSLALETGKVINNNGGHDLLGNTIVGKPDRGAFEFQD